MSNSKRIPEKRHYDAEYCLFLENLACIFTMNAPEYIRGAYEEYQDNGGHAVITLIGEGEAVLS